MSPRPFRSFSVLALAVSLALPLAGLTACFDDDNGVVPGVEVGAVDVVVPLDQGNAPVLGAIGTFQFASGGFLAAGLEGTATSATFTETEVGFETAGGSAIYNYTVGSVDLGVRVSATGTFPADEDVNKTFPAELEIDASDLTVGTQGTATVILVLDGVSSDPLTVDIVVNDLGGGQFEVEIQGVGVVTGEIDASGDFTWAGSGS